MTGKPCQPGCRCGKHCPSEQQRAKMSVSVSAAMKRSWARRKGLPEYCAALDEHNRSRYGRGCRCPVCRADNRDYQRALRARHRAVPRPPIRVTCGKRCEAHYDDGPTCEQCGALRGDKVNVGRASNRVSFPGKGGPRRRWISGPRPFLRPPPSLANSKPQPLKGLIP